MPNDIRRSRHTGMHCTTPIRKWLLLQFDYLWLRITTRLSHTDLLFSRYHFYTFRRYTSAHLTHIAPGLVLFSYIRFTLTPPSLPSMICHLWQMDRHCLVSPLLYELVTYFTSSGERTNSLPINSSTLCRSYSSWILAVNQLIPHLNASSAPPS